MIYHAFATEVDGLRGLQWLGFRPPSGRGFNGLRRPSGLRRPPRRFALRTLDGTGLDRTGLERLLLGSTLPLGWCRFRLGRSLLPGRFALCATEKLFDFGPQRVGLVRRPGGSAWLRRLGRLRLGAERPGFFLLGFFASTQKLEDAVDHEENQPHGDFPPFGGSEQRNGFTE
ncbi:MAG: hypothetical protein IH898_14115 [Planctomycetes bacterium]|nr:hypothetical protein [Planctomycetota bacterium]